MRLLERLTSYSIIVILVLFASDIRSQNVGIGTLTPIGKLHIKGSTNTSQLIIDAHSTQGNTNPLIKLRNSLGNDLLWIHADDTSNVFMGLKAGRVNDAISGAVYNTFIGLNAGYSNTFGFSNTAIGTAALYSNNTGVNNTANGYVALFSNTSGNNNLAFGSYSLSANTTGNNNTSNGFGALLSNTSGNNNTAIGNNALYTTTTGSNNTAIGYDADVSVANIFNATAIGSKAYAGASNSVVIGSINGINGAVASTNVGIGTSTPNARLHVAGTLKVVDGTQGDGKILTSDAAGLASWQSPPLPPPTYYPSVGICCQSWMIKNLDVAVYRNGDAIPNVTNSGTWAALTTGAYCYYNNDSTTYAAVYGKLYNWHAVNDPRGLAPEGWHIPSDFEWTTIVNCLGGSTVAGGLMKETGTIHWLTPNAGATNLSNFTGVPGGYRNSAGDFATLGNDGNWWSVTESTFDPTLAWNLALTYFIDDIYTGIYNKHMGFSIRCIKD